MSNKNCNCWVKDLPQEQGWSLRWGAHSVNCPEYRISLDPVDRQKDELNRLCGEAQQRVN